MHKIYKYKLDVANRDKMNAVYIEVVQNSKFLSIGVQDDEVVVWMMHDSEDENFTKDTCNFYVYLTGEEIYGYMGEKFLQTIQIGGLVCHIFK